jgi:hypothetical protein
MRLTFFSPVVPDMQRVVPSNIRVHTGNADNGGRGFLRSADSNTAGAPVIIIINRSK